MQVACVVLPSVACTTQQHFPTLSHKQHDFQKQLLNEKSVFRDFLQLLHVIFFILRRNERDMIENVCWSSCKMPLIVVRVQRHLKFLDSFSKNTQIPNFIKIRPVGDELFRADERTVITIFIYCIWVVTRWQ